MVATQGTSPEEYKAGMSARNLKEIPFDQINIEDIGAFSVPHFRNHERGSMTMEQMEDLGIVTPQAREDMSRYKLWTRGEYDPEAEAIERKKIELMNLFSAAGEKQHDRAEEDALYVLKTSRKEYWTRIKAGHAISGQGVISELQKVLDKADKYREFAIQESQIGSEDSETAAHAREASNLFEEIAMNAQTLPAVRAAIEGN